MSDEEIGHFWESQREGAILLLIEVLEIDLCTLWGYRTPDDGFLLAITRATYSSLEQPAVAKSGSQRQLLWRLLALVAAKYEQHETTISGALRLLLEFEHLASPLAEFVQSLLEEHNDVSLVVLLLSELVGLMPSQMGADSSAANNVSTFIQAIAQRVPLMLACNLNLLEPHLDSDAYSVRCGTVSAYGELIIQLAKPELVKLRATQPEVAEAAAGLFAAPIARLADVSAYVRSRALQTLSVLCKSRVLALNEFQETAAQGLQRLADKNANVRRSALQLFCALLDFNPFCSVLRRDLLEQRRQKLLLVRDSACPILPVEAAMCAASVEEREQSAALELLERALLFEDVLQTHVPVVVQLLNSQTNSDVVEAMNAVVAAASFDVLGVQPSVLLTLIWSKEQTVKDAAIRAVQAVWLPPNDGSSRDASMHTLGVARGLLELVNKATLAELTSLEQVVAEWQAQKLLPASLLSIFWETLQGLRPEMRAPKYRCAGLMLLNMAAVSDPLLLRCKLDVLIAQLRCSKVDLAIARHLCVSIQCCATAGPLPAKAVRSLVHIIHDILLSSPAKAASRLWASSAEQAINTVFSVSEQPEENCTQILHGMAAKMDGSAIDAGALSRFLFAIGHVAIKALVRIEACEKQLARQRLAEADGLATPAPADEAGRILEPLSRKREGARLTEDAMERELGAGEAKAAADAETLLSMGERLLHSTSLLGAWAPLVSAVCSNPDGHFGAGVRVSASLTLCKLMCVSSSYCEDNLQLLFSVLRHELDHVIRGNICVALGDLAVRHPNIVEPWTAQLYSQLRDPNVRVRKNMLMVLTHLILNDMVKVKGQISEMALCMIDTDPKVASLARLFFTEFAKKGSSPVYNLLPDMVATLSAGSRVDSSSFRDIMSFLISLIQKERQTESIVEKLCLRLDASDDVQYHRDLAFCIGALTHSERSIRKLQDLSKTFLNKLHDVEFASIMCAMVQKTRKFAKPSLKANLDELDGLLSTSELAGADAACAHDKEADLSESHVSHQLTQEVATPSRNRAGTLVDENAAPSQDAAAAAKAKKAVKQSTRLQAAPSRAKRASRKAAPVK
ncbi:hypothetical protein AB1Y20_012738 [Prymnesium parvum]